MNSKKLLNFNLVNPLILQVGETGKVYGIDHIDQLVKDSLANIKKGNPDLLEKDKIKVVCKCIIFLHTL